VDGELLERLLQAQADPRLRDELHELTDDDLSRSPKVPACGDL
jgi:hypothetical protein